MTARTVAVPTVWGVGSVGSRPWPVAPEDIADETKSAVEHLRMLGIREGGLVLIVSRLAEAIQLGQRVRKFALDVRENGAWREWIADGSSIGMHTILRGPVVNTDGVRLRILESAASPCLSELSLLKVPDVPAP